jgi:ubiquinone/menaquinone biosynthesis C-methylase UbiE
MLKPLLRRALRGLGRGAELDAGSGYDLWSSTYDEETNNVLVTLDEGTFGRLLERLDLRGKRVVDVGCGTGRHWRAILAREPSELVGYDVSPGMLSVLRRKHPRATVHLGSAEALAHHGDGDADAVISTLTLCHVAALDAALDEWVRVLRPGGDLLITDFHPAAAATSQCSFRRGAAVHTVKLHVHTLAGLDAAAARNHLGLLERSEARVDDAVRPHFERADMLAEFERMKGKPLLYGAHFRKPARGSP